MKEKVFDIRYVCLNEIDLDQIPTNRDLSILTEDILRFRDL